MENSNWHRSQVTVVIFSTFLMIASGASWDCERPSDVVFALDASNSIWLPDFHRQLDFVRSVIDKFNVGEEDMRVGAISFSDVPRIQFHLNHYYYKRDIEKAIHRITRHGGKYTFTNDAIRYMRTRCFHPAKGSRGNVTKIGIIITDGRSYDTAITGAEAKFARKQGIHLFAVGVGQKVDHNELNVIASSPPQHYSFMVENSKGLRNIKNLLAEEVCSVPEPSTTATTTTTATTRTATHHLGLFPHRIWWNSLLEDPPTTATTTTTTTTTTTRAAAPGNLLSARNDLKTFPPTTHTNKKGCKNEESHCINKKKRCKDENKGCNNWQPRCENWNLCKIRKINNSNRKNKNKALIKWQSRFELIMNM